MLKYKRIFTYLISTTLIIGIAILLIYKNMQYTQKMEYNKFQLFLLNYDRSRLDIILNGIADIYDKEGRLITSLDELENTSFYPYKQNFKNIMVSTKYFKIVKCNIRLITITKNYFIIKGYLIGDNNCLTTEIKIKRFNNVQETKLKIDSFITGTNARLKMIEEINNFISYIYPEQSYLEYLKQGITIKPIASIPFNHNYPTSPKELVSYIDWLKKTEGLNYIKNSWNKPLLFKLENNKIKCATINTW